MNDPLGTTADSLAILIVDDHDLIREGLKLTLRHLQHGVTTLEADSIEAAIARFQEAPGIDLVLLDLGLPGMTGIQALDTFLAACAGARVVVVSAAHDLRTVQASLRLGASGFIPKLSNGPALLNALRLVLGGGIYVPPEVFLAPAVHTPAALPAGVYSPGRAILSDEDMAEFAQDDGIDGRAAITSPQAARLTARQRDVMWRLLQGKSNRQICVEMGLAIGTVKSHVAAILKALGARSRAQVVASVHGPGWRAMLQRKGKPAAA